MQELDLFLRRFDKLMNTQNLTRIATLLLIAATVHLAFHLIVKAWIKSAHLRAEMHAKLKPLRPTILLDQIGVNTDRAEQRTKTIGTVLRSFVGFTIWIVTALTIMNILGIPMGPLLTSAGVGGVALAFGAQSLVKDFLTGVFMIMEDQYGVGDYITLSDVSGTVEEVSLRATRLRDQTGLVWYIPNGEIKRVGNHSQGWTSVVIDIPVSYAEDPIAVKAVLSDMAEKIDLDADWAKPLLERPTVLGVGNLASGTLTMQILAKCEPNQQWGVQREIRSRAKDALDAAGIKGPQLYGHPSN